MIGLFESLAPSLASTALFVAVLALLLLVLAGLALGLESSEGRAFLRRFAWVRRFERLHPTDLRFRGLLTLGVGVCCFAALLTLRLFAPVPPWTAVTLATLAVVAITLGAALLERAATSR
jgi:hypothetical protein